MKRIFLGVLLLLGLALEALGQVSAPALINQRGTTTPSICTIGQLFFDTDATAGANIYGCTAANTWTIQSGGSPSGSGAAGRVTYWSSATALTSSASLLYDDSTKRFTVGTGSGTSAGIIAGYEGTNSGYSALWSTGVTPSNLNYALRLQASETILGAVTDV